MSHKKSKPVKQPVKPITPAEVVAHQSQPPPELIEAINDWLIDSPTPLEMQVSCVKLMTIALALPNVTKEDVTKNMWFDKIANLYREAGWGVCYIKDAYLAFVVDRERI